MLLHQKDIQDLDRIYRLNLINGITGAKPVNLIGTRSEDGQDNLAIFSSVVHLGSNPAQLGMVTRPQTPDIKDTFANIRETGVYTINQVAHHFIKKAHYTSAKFEKEISEFDAVNLTRERIADFPAPFVAASPVKIGMQHIQNIDLPNGCILIIGEVVLLEVPDPAVDEKGYINMEEFSGVALSGLNRYYSLRHQADFPFVRVEDFPDFKE